MAATTTRNTWSGVVSQQNTTAPLSERTCPSFATKSTPFADHPLFSFSRTQDEENLLALYGEAQSSIERILDSPGEGCSPPPSPRPPSPDNAIVSAQMLTRCSPHTTSPRPQHGTTRTSHLRALFVRVLATTMNDARLCPVDVRPPQARTQQRVYATCSTSTASRLTGGEYSTAHFTNTHT